MNRALFLFLGAVALLTNQCTTRTIDLTLPTGTSRLVLLGLMTTNDSVDVFVSRTIPARGQPPADVYERDAAVQVLANGQVVADRGRYVGGGVYRLRREQPLQAGVAYQVRATTPAFGTLTSRPDTLPEAVAVTSFVTKGGSFTLTFTDPPGPHYYVLDVELYYQGERVFRVPNFVQTFSDELFEGKLHEITGTPPDYGTLYTPTSEEPVNRADFARIRLLSVSRQTHQFFADIDDYDLASESPDVEPTSPLSGIPDGVGYFGAGNSTAFYILRSR